MSRLLRDIKHYNEQAAAELQGAGLHTDSDIQSLTREELHELFPGPKHLKLRRAIFAIIHEKKPVEQLLKNLKEFIPHESFRAALTNNGVLVDYLHILKDMKTQMNHVQSFLDAHIGLLEEFSTNQPDNESATGGPEELPDVQPDGRGAPGTGTSATDDPMESYNGQTDGCPQGAAGTGTSDAGGEMKPHAGQTGGHPHGPQSTDGPVASLIGQTDGGPQGAPATGTSDARVGMKPPAVQTLLKYKMVVSGKTFDAHLKLMEKVKAQFKNQDWLTKDDQDHDITFVFCPICSRVASDVEAAMTDVKDDKPVILVLMHHTREVKYTSSLKTWHEDKRIVLVVDVFYHETLLGLLRCSQNNDAVSKIGKELLKRILGSKGAESGLTGNTSGGGDNDGGSGGPPKWYQRLRGDAY